MGASRNLMQDRNSEGEVQEKNYAHDQHAECETSLSCQTFKAEIVL